MNPSRLLRFLLSRVLCLGVVEEGDGGEPEDDVDGADDAEEGGDTDSEGGETDEAEDDEGDDPDAANDDDAEEGDDDGGLVVSLGGEETPADADEKGAPEWVRDLRRTNRELVRKQRENEAEIARLKGAPAQPAAIVVGEKPTLEGCGWDGDEYAKKLDAWHERKRQADEQKRATDDAQKQQQDAWQKTQDAYTTAKGALKLKDFQDAEETVKDSLSVPQQGMLIDALAPKQAALMVYALGKNPAKLKELAAITSPVKFVVAVARLESQLKVTPKKSAPAPERTARSSVPSASAVDNQMERLRKEARISGDYSKVADMRRAQDAKKKKSA